MSKTIITRRDFVCSAAALLAIKTLFKSSPEFGPVIEKIKQWLPVAMAQKDITGASLALIHGEDIVWSGGFGYTDRSQQVKVTADTLFHAGSISKSFTALGVLKAVDKGLLALDAPLKKHLPWFSVNSRNDAAESDGITFRHVLSHHSGLGTWSPLGNPSDPQYHTRTFEEVVKSTRDSWLKFPPGERFEYSNQGIDLAGYALAVASGKRFADFMHEELLAPMGMNVSTFHQASVTQSAACAVGFMGKRPVPVVNGIVMPLVAAGGLFTSANDLARFVIFHLQGGGKQLVSKPLVREMYTPQFTARDQLCGYGLGIYKAIQHDTARLSHGGLGYGISTHYRILPEQKIGVVVLTNQDAAHNAPEFASRIVELMLAAKLGTVPKNKPINVTTKTTVSLDESTLRRFEGTYLLYEGILFRFKYEKGNLFHVAGNEKLRLVAHSATEFTNGSRRYRFLLTDNGRPKGVQIVDAYYDPQTSENSVIYLPVNATPADARGLNKPEWSRHAGSYAGTFIGGSSEVKVSLANGYLYLNGELRLTEVTRDFFITADGDAVMFKDERVLVGNKLYSKRR